MPLPIPEPHDRRRGPRVDLLATIAGQLITLDEPVRVRQIGEGGLLIETRVPLSRRTSHDLRVSGDAGAVAIRCTVRHARVLVDGDRVTYLTGLALEATEPHTAARFRELAGALFPSASDTTAA